jgi:hypothetical protein
LQYSVSGDSKVVDDIARSDSNLDLILSTSSLGAIAVVTTAGASGLGAWAGDAGMVSVASLQDAWDVVALAETIASNKMLTESNTSLV